MSVSKTKVPKKGVLLLGSGYGALKVAEDVAQAGIPVVWVTRAQHFWSCRREWNAPRNGPRISTFSSVRFTFE